MHSRFCPSPDGLAPLLGGGRPLDRHQAPVKRPVKVKEPSSGHLAVMLSFLAPSADGPTPTDLILALAVHTLVRSFNRSFVRLFDFFRRQDRDGTRGILVRPGPNQRSGAGFPAGERDSIVKHETSTNNTSGLRFVRHFPIWTCTWTCTWTLTLSWWSSSVLLLLVEVRRLHYLPGAKRCCI